MDKYVSVKEASELLSISTSLLWELKQTKELEAGKHWIFATGKRKSNVLWNVVGIRNWQIAKTKESENAPDDGAAKKIVTYQKMGV